MGDGGGTLAMTCWTMLVENGACGMLVLLRNCKLLTKDGLIGLASIRNYKVYEIFVKITCKNIKRLSILFLSDEITV